MKYKLQKNVIARCSTLGDYIVRIFPVHMQGVIRG